MDYREALLLWSARETGVIEAVTTDAGTPTEVAERADVTERAARITLDAMAELGYLERLGDGAEQEAESPQYEITNAALGFIAKRDVRSIGSVPHVLDCVDRWLRLPETMRTGDLPEPPENWTTNFVGAMAATDEAFVRAGVTAAVHRNPDAERVLDAGGGPGLFAKEFARRGFDVTLADRPEVVETTQRFLEREPIEVVEADVTEDLPTRFDLVFCSRVAHTLGPEENRQFLERAYDALEPGGAIVLVDKVRGRADDAALFGAHMLAQTERGDTYTESEFTDWLEDSGFEETEIRDLPGTDQQVIAGRK